MDCQCNPHKKYISGCGKLIYVCLSFKSIIDFDVISLLLLNSNIIVAFQQNQERTVEGVGFPRDKLFYQRTNFFYLLRTFCPHLGRFFFCCFFLLRFGQISPLAFFRWLTATSDRNAESCNRILCPCVGVH